MTDPSDCLTASIREIERSIAAPAEQWPDEFFLFVSRITPMINVQAKGEATIAMASDLQDPPELIPRFVRKWEEGFKIVLAQKTNREESALIILIRKMHYNVINRLSRLS